MLGGVMTIRNPAVKVGQGFALMSDLHLGSAHTDEGLILDELRGAAARRDRVLLNGDVLDLILPQDAKRFLPSVLHPRFQGVTDLINKVVNFAADLLAPFAHLLDLVGSGNHESACEKHHAFDPVLALVEALNARLAARKHPHRVKHGGYCGFSVYPVAGAGPGRELVFFYHHGFGGGSTLSGAAGDLNRMLAQLEGVDVVWLGHKHQKLAGHAVRIAPAPAGDHPATRDVRFVRTGAYLDATKGQSQESLLRRGRQSVYSVDKGYPFSGLGGARVVLEAADPLKVRVTQ